MLKFTVRVSLGFRRPKTYLQNRGTTNFRHSMGGRNIKMDDNIRYVYLTCITIGAMG